MPGGWGGMKGGLWFDHTTFPYVQLPTKDTLGLSLPPGKQLFLVRTLNLPSQ